VVCALMGLMDNEKAYGEVFNVGGKKEVTILDLAEAIIQKTGSSSAVQLIPYDEAFEKDFEDMQRRVPGIEKIKRVTGFEPRTDFDAILQKVIDYIKEKGNPNH